MPTLMQRVACAVAPNRVPAESTGRGFGASAPDPRMKRHGQAERGNTRQATAPVNQPVKFQHEDELRSNSRPRRDLWHCTGGTCPGRLRSPGRLSGRPEVDAAAAGSSATPSRSRSLRPKRWPMRRRRPCGASRREGGGRHRHRQPSRPGWQAMPTTRPGHQRRGGRRTRHLERHGVQRSGTSQAKELAPQSAV